MNNLLDICRLCMTKLAGVAIDCLQSDQIQLCKNIKTLYNLEITKNDKCSTKICPSCYTIVLMSKIHYTKVIQTQFNIQSALKLSKDLFPMVNNYNYEVKRGVKRQSTTENEVTSKKLKLIDVPVAKTNSNYFVKSGWTEKPGVFMNSSQASATFPKPKSNSIWTGVDLTTPQYSHPSLAQRQQICYSSVFDSEPLAGMIRTALPTANFLNNKNIQATEDKPLNVKVNLNDRISRHKSSNIFISCHESSFDNISASDDKMSIEESDINNNFICNNFTSKKPSSTENQFKKISERVLHETIKHFHSFPVMEYLQKIDELTQQMSQLKLDVLSNVHSKSFFSI